MSAAAVLAPETAATAPDRFDPALPIALIVPSPLNPRHRLDKTKLAELADSLRTKGQLTPVLVRPVQGGKYELAAGHRRHAASKLAGRATLAATIREMDDDTFLEILTIENMQHQGLTPLEEAAGYAALRTRGYDARTIAMKVSKSESYVYRRLALAKLIPSAKVALEKAEIELGHAEVLAPLPEVLQKELLRRCLDDCTVRELRDLVRRRHLLNLKRAPWAMSDATLPGGACAACPKRTGAEPMLFADLATSDSCLDEQCHATKLKAFLVRRRQELEARHGKALVILDKDPYGHDRLQADPPAGAVKHWDIQVVAKGTVGAQPAMIWRSDKPDVGQVVYVRKPVRRTPSDGNKYQLEQRRKYEAARRKTRAHVEAALAAGAGADITQLAKVPQLPILVAGALTQMSGDTNNLLKQVDWVPKACTTRPRGLRALATIETLGAPEQARLLVLLTLLPYAPVHAYSSDGGATTLTRFCNEFGISVQRYVAAAERVHAAAERAKKKEKSKATKTPAKKSAKRRAGDVAAERKKQRATRAPAESVWIDDGDEEP